MTTYAESGATPARLPVTAEQWRAYLTEYSDWYLRIYGITVADTIPLVGLTMQQVSARWLGYQPATEQMIAATEERLGVKLPPSLRGFLLTSNGWGPVSEWTDALSSCDEIDWFRTTHPEFFNAAEQAADDDNDFFTIFAHCLNIAQGQDAFLLDTREVSADGEYDAYLFAIKYGVLEPPCKSFSELIALGREEIASLRNEGDE